MAFFDSCGVFFLFLEVVSRRSQVCTHDIRVREAIKKKKKRRRVLFTTINVCPFFFFFSCINETVIKGDKQCYHASSQLK